MPLTDNNSVVTQAIIDLIKKNWDGIGFPSKDVIYYGDQGRYPVFPSASVEPAPQQRDLNQTGLQQRIFFTMFIMLYHGGIKNAELRLKEADEISEKVKDQLHKDRQLGGSVIHGHVTNIEPGFVNRGGLLSVTRLTWEGVSNYTMP